MGAQIDCIIYNKFFQPLSDSILKYLDDLFKKKTHDVWLTVYLALFVLLHNTAMLTKRDEEYARQAGIAGRYANPQDIKALHRGAINLLAHFHGVLGGPVPFRQAGTGHLEGYRKNWEVSEQQETFMRTTYLRTRVMSKSPQKSPNLDRVVFSYPMLIVEYP